MPTVLADDGAEIHYQTWGRRDAPALLMIQGLGTDSRGWALQRVAMGRRYRCLAVDNRGSGQSDKPPGPYALDRMASDAVSVLDAEGIDEAHVMGASMGGVIAQIIGVLHPERVRSLVLACTACSHHDWRRELFADWAEIVRVRGIGALSEDALHWLVGPRIQRRFGVWINLLARIVLQQPAEAFVAQIDAILDAPDELRSELVHVRAPTLVITGSQDSLTPLGDAEEIAELIPGAELAVLSGAAHGLMVEAPIAYNDAVLEFLSRVDAATDPASAAEVEEARAVRTA